MYYYFFFLLKGIVYPKSLSFENDVVMHSSSCSTLQTWLCFFFLQNIKVDILKIQLNQCCT